MCIWQLYSKEVTLLCSDREACHLYPSACCVLAQPFPEPRRSFKTKIRCLYQTTDPLDTSKSCTVSLHTLFRWTLRPVHAKKIQKYMWASILLVAESKEHVPSSRFINSLCQDIDTRMVQTRPSVRPPLISLRNSCCLWNGRHHSQQRPCKGFASHSPVIVAACNCTK